MKKEVKLTNEERMILRKLSNPQLFFLKGIAEHKDFLTLPGIVNVLIDTEKNIFFADDETQNTPEVLYAKHAYARGGIAKLTIFMRLIVGAQQEISYREAERIKRQKEGK